MRAPKTVAALLAATLALPLAGCFGLPTPGEIANHAGEIASRADDLAAQALELADTLSGIDYGKTSRLVVRDAATGDVVREVSFADSSLQYCATCQTGGKPLADRRLSRLLK